MASVDITGGIASAIDSATKLLDDALNAIWPSPEKKASAEAIAVKAASDATIAKMAQSMSVMLAEANSSDPYTSRARPSFLYVVYVLLLWGIPMSILFAIKPEAATAVCTGFKMWLEAIPPLIIDLFKWVMLGYIGGRSAEKGLDMYNKSKK